MLSELANRLTFLWIPFTFLLTTCAPLPKEGDSSNQAEVTLTLQHRSSERIERAGSSSRATEFIVVVAGGTAFSEAGPTSPLNSGVLNLSSAQIKLSLNLDTPLRLFIYRYATVLTSNQLLSKLTSQTLDDGAIDYGVTDNFTISSASNTNQLSLTVQLQRETTFLDSAVQGLNYTTGGRSATTDQDGLLFYFPDETIELKLSEISLGSYTNPPSILTPYSIMGGTEGTPTDNVTNLVRLLLSLDSDSDADNGIQLNTNQFNNLSGLSLADFNVDNLSFTSSKVPGLTLPSVQKAQKHLSRTMRQKNLATAGSGLSSPLPFLSMESRESQSMEASAWPLLKISAVVQSLQAAWSLPTTKQCCHRHRFSETKLAALQAPDPPQSKYDVPGHRFCRLKEPVWAAAPSQLLLELYHWE